MGIAQMRRPWILKIRLDTAMKRRRLVQVTRRRMGGRKKSRARVGPLPFLFYLALVLLAAILAETLVTGV